MITRAAVASVRNPEARVIPIAPHIKRVTAVLTTLRLERSRKNECSTNKSDTRDNLLGKSCDIALPCAKDCEFGTHRKETR